MSSSSNRRSQPTRLWPLAAGLLAAGLSGLSPASAQDAGQGGGNVTLNETGSTLLYPLFQLWIPDYGHVATDVSLTAAATGSGAGVDAAIAGNARIGASDAYMSDEQVEKNRGILNVAVAISAQTVNYNIPGLNDKDLKLDGPTLAGIFTGVIKMWDAPEIAAMNPGVQLPHQAIIPIRREDASGDTFIFTQFLDFSAQTWGDKIGYGTAISWPTVEGEKVTTGNDGVVQALAATPYSVGYVGISFHEQIAKDSLGTAMLKNQSGKFLLPSADSISKGASQLDPRTPADERLTLVFAPGDDSYPLINYEYVVVSTKQTNPGTAEALRHFLLWAISADGGNAPKYLDTVGFIPLPTFIRALSENQINQIK
jgi:phosphate transport system substrate-binding protein